MLGSSYEKNPWSPSVMTITRKAIWLKRHSYLVSGALKNEFKILHGMELLQMQGFDMSDIKGAVPESAFATQLAGNAFNGFAMQAFTMATTCGSVIVDDPTPQEGPGEDGGDDGSYSCYISDDSEQ